MICDTCFRMLRGQEGRIWKGTYDLHFVHHTNGETFCQSAKMSCGICRVLLEELELKCRTEATPLKFAELSITASLSRPPREPHLYHLYQLDFKLKCDNIRSKRTFLLKETDSGNPPFRTPVSGPGILLA
ncbi:hypothetical protein P280DRAFT_251244 [Massarina eburnea CBS 473.64]|uniref:Uncharacterized protein n=1 Tax=Massarina eburnea CBS 473.64 TaxID=1395130 RepID=A0A6A6S6W1_9PLEO|nr:hypothetical protein P280DRAFT_251244 [Massarina eburnea CBS 473.64]